MIPGLAVLLLVVIFCSYAGAQRCDCGPAQETEEAPCRACSGDAPFLIHEQETGLECGSAAVPEVRSDLDQVCLAEGYPAGVFRPPNSLA